MNRTTAASRRLFIRYVLMAVCLVLYGAGGSSRAEAQTCAGPSGVEQQVVYNNDAHVLQYCNGTSWQAVGKAGTGSGSCNSPSGPEGSIVYNSDYHTYQFCNGSGWAAFEGGPYRCSACTLFGNTVPATTADADATSVVLGVTFYSEVPGKIVGLRFYKGAGNTGTHVGALWDATTTSGSRLAQVTFTGETASGWQTMNFAAPVAIQAFTPYVASYLAPQGHYPVGSTAQNFGQAFDKEPLHAYQDSSIAGDLNTPNGVYKYSGTMVFPNDTYSSTNYFVDVIFATD